MQHVAGVLDAVLGRLLRGRESVVPGSMEVLEAAAPVLQLVALAWHDGLLLGHTAGTGMRTRVEGERGQLVSTQDFFQTHQALTFFVLGMKI